MERREISFPFKGERSYIQGPDLFNQMMVIFPDRKLSEIRFSAHGFLRSPNCFLYFGNVKDDIESVEGIETRCQLNIDGEAYWMCLTPGDIQTEINRQAYDESVLIAQCVLDGDRITLAGESPYTFIETVVSMNKHLLQMKYPDEQGKWIFTRIDLPELCCAQTKLALIFKHNLNFRLTKSDILVDGEKVGDLYFSLVRP